MKQSRIPVRRGVRRGLAVVVAAAAATVGLELAAAPGVVAQVTVRTRAAEATTAVDAAGPSRTLALPFAARYVAVHWAGAPDAVVTVQTSADGVTFGPAVDAGRDEVGEQKGNGETYGSLLAADGARAVRVTSDRPLGRLSVVGLADGQRVVRHVRGHGSAATASVAQPTVIPRSGWGADESLRYDSSGKEVWPPTFWPIQKLIVHHTATQNNDPNPAATIRAIYYYHAVTQGWGDIGYNFLVDEQGRVYEGRHSRTYAPGESPTGEDTSGNGVTGAHAQGFNSGTAGIALLGTLSNQDATPAARDGLESMLAWKADRHHIDPQGSSLYTNPVNGTQKTFPNIAGHRDVNATECPGGTFYATLPLIRSDVAARIAAANGGGTTTTSSTTTSSTTTSSTTTSTSTSTTSTTLRKKRK